MKQTKRNIAAKASIVSLASVLLCACGDTGMYGSAYYPGSTATGLTQDYCPIPRVVAPQNAVDIVQDSPIPVPLCGYPA